MHKFEADLRLKSLISLQVSLLAFIIGLTMIYLGYDRFIFIGTKNNGTADLMLTQYLFGFIPDKTTFITSVKDIKFRTDTAEDKSLFTHIVIITDSNEISLFGPESNISDQEKRQIYNDLCFFIEIKRKENLSKTFSSSEKYVKYGIIISILGFLYLFSRFVTFLNTKLIKKQLDKTIIRIKKSVRVLIKVNDLKNISNIEQFRLPDLDRIGILCSSEIKIELQKKFRDTLDYFVTDSASGSARQVLLSKEWMKDFSGYLIVCLQNSDFVNKSNLTALIEDHNKRDNECTFLTFENRGTIQSKNKILRNIVYRVIKISELEEKIIPEDNAEISLEVYLLNTKKVFEYLDQIISAGKDEAVPFLRIVEYYFKNNYKVDSYCANKSELKNVTDKPYKPGPQGMRRKTCVGLIIPAGTVDIERTKINLSALVHNKVEDIGIITHPDNRNEYKKITGPEFELIFTEGKKGDGFDVLQASEWLKDLTGTVIIIPDVSPGIPVETLTKMMLEHNSRGNTCTYTKIGASQESIIYCVNSAQLFSALRKSSPSKEDINDLKLFSVIDILRNEGRTVKEILK